MQKTLIRFLGQKTPWRGHRLPTPGFLGFPGGSDSKESACNVGDLGSTPGLGRSPGRGHGNPLQCSCLENPHGQRSLAGRSPRGREEPDTTERLSRAPSIVRTTEEDAATYLGFSPATDVLQSVGQLWQNNVHQLHQASPSHPSQFQTDHFLAN